MLVVILITVIVVGLAFSVLNLIQKQLHGARENLGEQQNQQTLQQALWRDFSTFSKIYYDSRHQVLVCQNPLEQVNYQFLEGRVLRNKDTMEVMVDQVEYYFLEKPISDGQLDAVRLGFDQERSILVYTINTSEKFMY